jgi:hypothetical protein
MVERLSARETKILEKHASQDQRQMTTAVHTMLRDYAGASWPTMNHKGRMAQLERKLGFGHRRVRSLYQNEPGVSVRAEEAARIAELVASREEASRAEDRALAQRVAELEATLALVVAALDRDEVASRRLAARAEVIGSHTVSSGAHGRR